MILDCWVVDKYFLPYAYMLMLYLQSAFKDGRGPGGEVWTTYSEISGKYFGTIFASLLSPIGYIMDASELTFKDGV